MLATRKPNTHMIGRWRERRCPAAAQTVLVDRRASLSHYSDRLLTPITPMKRAEMLVSVLIPVFNEVDTVAEIVERVRATPYKTEIICVDDASTDGTRDVLAKLLAERKIDQAIYQKENQGKGAAVRAAIAASHGDVVIVQDADLEYSPADWPTIFEPLVQGRADAVFGSRFLGGTHRVLYYWHSVGNGLLTTLSNMFSNLNLTDMTTLVTATSALPASFLTPSSPICETVSWPVPVPFQIRCGEWLIRPLTVTFCVL